MQKLRILVAERQGLAAVRLKAELEILGHQVVGIARDGWEVATSAWRVQPDLVIVDNQLPLLKGIESARAILSRSAVPIILLTAYASAELVRRAREAGVMAYLVKPVDRRQLRSAIEAALARFGELQFLRQEVHGMQEAVKARELLEPALRVLMGWLKLPKAEALQRMEQYRRSTGTGVREIASRIVRADELLFRTPNLAHWLQIIVRAIRRAKLPTWASRGPAVQDLWGR